MKIIVSCSPNCLTAQLRRSHQHRVSVFRQLFHLAGKRWRNNYWKALHRRRTPRVQWLRPNPPQKIAALQFSMANANVNISLYIDCLQRNGFCSAPRGAHIAVS